MVHVRGDQPAGTVPGGPAPSPSPSPPAAPAPPALGAPPRSAPPTPPPTGGSTQTSAGTGFLIHRSGYIVTNEHVIQEARNLRVTLYDGRDLPACVAGADPQTDIALLKIETPDALPVLPLGDSERLRVGEPVFAIGNPFLFNHSVTAGIVSAKERVIDRRSEVKRPSATDVYSFFIQTDASINVGNSGGPLVDRRGAVVGINAAFWGGHPLQPAQGIGFAIPINMAKALLPRLRDAGHAPRSFLGVDAQTPKAALAATLHLPSARGALIAMVAPGSPAEQAGLEPGDVVVSWDGVPIAGDEDLKIDSQLTPPGRRVKLGIVRDGKRIDREVTTRSADAAAPRTIHPSACGRAGPPAGSGPGFDWEPVAAAEAKRLPGGRGVAIARVVPGGPAAEAKLRGGDVVLRVDKAGIRAPDDLAKALAARKPGDTVLLLLRRDGSDFWAAIRLR